MAGSGVAVRLHEFREDCRKADDLTPKSSRLGRDVRGLYPGQLGRVHVVHSKDCGFPRGRSRSLPESPDPPCGNHQRSFDVRTLRALSVLRQNPAVLDQRPPSDGLPGALPVSSVSQYFSTMGFE
ncbi:hypothetical protein FQN60_018592 [Etheostoma spectabile]|uniref:Uncharacterized protein n=1 Tax=Etheostoma spectabile TaxID=54343 RepID=A0A5J5DIG2_9PERO|nr:hypothetical protein FQN60_018592 [Etheostoma spectabile]